MMKNMENKKNIVKKAVKNKKTVEYAQKPKI